MVLTGASLWFVTTFVIVAASFFDELSPENVNFWRIYMGIPALLAGVSILVIAARVDKRWFYPIAFTLMMPGFLVNAILIQITPATAAILLNMLVTVIYAGYFMRIRELSIALVAATIVALSPIFTDIPERADYLESWLAVYLPAMFVLAFALHRQKSAIRKAIERADSRYRTDPLTGVGNLRALSERADEILDVGTILDGEVVGLVLVDLDNFKSANTLHGHLGGDHALRCVGKQLLRVLPEDSLVARVGGDEFAVMFKAKSENHVVETGGVLRGAVRATNIDIGLAGVAVDASVGIAVFPRDGVTLDDLLGAADDAMYAQKSKHHETVNATPPLADTEPAKLTKIGAPPPSGGQLEGKVSTFIATRTLYASATALGWLISVSALAVSLAMPGADHSHLVYMTILIGAGVLMAALLIAINPEAQSSWHKTFDITALAGIGVAMWLTGGADSPAMVLLILVVVSQAWFWGTRRMISRVAAPIAIALTPLAYQGIGEGGINLVAGTTIYTVVVLSLVLAGVLYFNHVVLESIRQRITSLAATDPLTGVANRRAFNAFVEAAIGSDPDDPQALSIVMIDLDNFKNVNTERGHHAGDELLAEIGRALAAVARDNDCFARIGGDEFAAALPGVGIDGAKAIAERFVATVAELPAAENANVTASAGFAICPLHGNSLDELVMAADTALMSVKSTEKGAARVGRIFQAV